MEVDLEVTSGELDSDEAASGTIAKIKVKALDTDNPDSGAPAWVKNYNKLDDSEGSAILAGEIPLTETGYSYDYCYPFTGCMIYSQRTLVGSANGSPNQ